MAFPTTAVFFFFSGKLRLRRLSLRGTERFFAVSVTTPPGTDSLTLMNWIRPMRPCRPMQRRQMEAKPAVVVRTKKKRKKKAKLFGGGLHICITNTKLILMHKYKYIYICIDFFYVVQ